MIRRALLAAVAAAWPAAASAVCTDRTACGCTVSASALSFGAYDPQAATPTDSVGTLLLDCFSTDANNTTVSISLSRGASNSVANRTLRASGATLSYNLYVDTGRTIIWGDQEASGVVAPFPPSGGAQTLRIYGRIPARQPIRAGAYSDTITIILTY